MNLKPLQASLAFVMLLAIGCTTVKPRVEGTGKSTPSSVEKKRAKVKKAMMNGGYKVEKGDTLWAISSSSDRYNDPFAWPLIFKSNKDKIQDPDLIYPNQMLVIPKDPTDAQMRKAQKQAHETPRSTPHSKPRTTLPVDYDE